MSAIRGTSREEKTHRSGFLMDPLKVGSTWMLEPVEVDGEPDPGRYSFRRLAGFSLIDSQVLSFQTDSE